jgi:nucleoside-diphosphate-sugar epimerase
MRFSIHSSLGIFVTGAGGFIGNGLCDLLGASGRLETIPMDVRAADEVRDRCRHFRPHAVIHLASEGTVNVPLRTVPQLLDTAVGGILNVLKCLNPTTIVFPSSCAVYGNTGSRPVTTSWRNINPLSIYGLSKATMEKVVELWARESRNFAMVLRLGNVIGRGGSGLIPLLVRHAVQNQDPVVPIRMRGGGRIIRDYVPLDYVAHVMLCAANCHASPGTTLTFNVGSGIGFTNRFVADIVQQVLTERGYELAIEWDPEPAFGEAQVALLDITETERQFGLSTPSRSAVCEAIEDAAVHCLQQSAPGAKDQLELAERPLTHGGIL